MIMWKVSVAVTKRGVDGSNDDVSVRFTVCLSVRDSFHGSYYYYYYYSLSRPLTMNPQE